MGARPGPLGRLMLRIVGRLARKDAGVSGCHQGESGVGQSSRKEIAGEGRLSYGDLGSAWWCDFVEYEHGVRGERLSVYWFVATHEFVANKEQWKGSRYVFRQHEDVASFGSAIYE